MCSLLQERTNVPRTEEVVPSSAWPWVAATCVPALTDKSSQPTTGRAKVTHGYHVET